MLLTVLVRNSYALYGLRCKTPIQEKASYYYLMPKKKKQTNKKGMIRVPPSGQVTYSGPLRLPRASANVTNRVERLTLVVTVQSTGAGIINNVFGNDLFTMTESADFTAIYDEYRCLGLEYKYVPNYKNVQGTIGFGPLICVVDRDSNAALLTLSAAFNYESALCVTAGTSFTKVVKMDSVKDAGYLSTAPGNVDTWWVKLYGNSVNNTTNYGVMYISGLYEFRGRI